MDHLVEQRRARGEAELELAEGVRQKNMCRLLPFNNTHCHNVIFVDSIIVCFVARLSLNLRRASGRRMCAVFCFVRIYSLTIIRLLLGRFRVDHFVNSKKAARLLDAAGFYSLGLAADRRHEPPLGSVPPGQTKAGKQGREWASRKNFALLCALIPP